MDGVLLLDKPRGLTSNAALQAVRRLLGAAKAGHTGTLDPMATGLLPICVGQATKFSAFWLDADKSYAATVTLGVATDTGDAEGSAVRTGSIAHIDRPRVEAALAALTGIIQQVPPMHSALKHAGRPLYEYARAGVTVERPSRTVVVHEMRLRRLEGRELDLEVRVSKGTYIRSLAGDLGEALGCGAHLSALRRTATAGFSVAEAVALEALEQMPAAERHALLRPVDLLLQSLPALVLEREAALQLLQGRAVRTELAPPPPSQARLYDEHARFLGVGEVVRPGEVVPRRLMSQAPGRGA